MDLIGAAEPRRNRQSSAVTIGLLIFSLLATREAGARSTFATESGHLGPSIGAGAIPEFGPLLFVKEFDSRVTTSFRWDDQTIALLDTQEKKIHLLHVADRGSELSAIELLADFKSDGHVFPGPASRHTDGTVYWLARGCGCVFRFRPDGSLIATFPTAFDDPFSMQLNADGSLTIFGTMKRREYAGYNTYSAQGMLLDRTSGWLTPRKEGNRFADMFFLNGPNRRIEILVYFPYARIRETGIGASVEETIHRLTCPELPADLLAALESNEARDGLPSPLGGGYRGEHPERPFILAAAMASPDHAVMLANGGTLLWLNAITGDITCRKVPAVEGEDSSGAKTVSVATSLSVAERWLTILSHRPDATTVRVWQLEENRAEPRD